MNKNYEFIFHQCADAWEKVTLSTIETMFERAENRDCKLKSFKDWLLQQPLSAYTRDRVEGIYQYFVE